VLLAVAAVAILLMKSGQKPAGETAPVQQEAAATPAPADDSAADKDKAATDTAAEEHADDAAATTETAAATTSEGEGEAAASEEDSNFLSEKGEFLSDSETKAKEAEEKPAETANKAEPITIPVTPKETATPIVPESGSLLAPSAALEVDMDNALAERAMGDPDAPVVMIEYASMTCPHCARFHNEILPKVKASLIDTGKLRLVFRDYPLDTHALRAAMMARCTDRANYFNLVEVIFKNQDRWVKSADPLAGLKQLGALAGMDSSYIESCIKNPQLEQFILSGMQDAQRKYKIKATPTFVFNNDAEQLSGDQNPEDFENMVQKLLKKGQ
jgi:protein-disulfide isomerase